MARHGRIEGGESELRANTITAMPELLCAVRGQIGERPVGLPPCGTIINRFLRVHMHMRTHGLALQCARRTLHWIGHVLEAFSVLSTSKPTASTAAARKRHHPFRTSSSDFDRQGMASSRSQTQTADPLFLLSAAAGAGRWPSRHRVRSITPSASLTYITHRHACLAHTPSTMSLAVSFAISICHKLSAQPLQCCW